MSDDLCLSLIKWNRIRIEYCVEMTRMDDMKMDFLLHIQTSQYDIAFEISQEILAICPNDALILKFSKFLHRYKGESIDLW